MSFICSSPTQKNLALGSLGHCLLMAERELTGDGSLLFQYWEHHLWLVVVISRFLQWGWRSYPGDDRASETEADLLAPEAGTRWLASRAMNFLGFCSCQNKDKANKEKIARWFTNAKRMVFYILLSCNYYTVPGHKVMPQFLTWALISVERFHWV